MSQWILMVLLRVLCEAALGHGNRLTLTPESVEKLFDSVQQYTAKERPRFEDLLGASPEIEEAGQELVGPPPPVDDDCLPLAEPKTEDWEGEDWRMADPEGGSPLLYKSLNQPNSDLVYPLDSSEHAFVSLLQEVLPQTKRPSDKRDFAFGCDCKIKNSVIDLGVMHYPRYLLNAVCEGVERSAPATRCRAGSTCKALNYRVTVLEWRSDKKRKAKDRRRRVRVWMPEDLKRFYTLKVVTVAAGCVCAR